MALGKQLLAPGQTTEYHDQCPFRHGSQRPAGQPKKEGTPLWGVGLLRPHHRGLRQAYGNVRTLTFVEDVSSHSHRRKLIAPLSLTGDLLTSTFSYLSVPRTSCPDKCFSLSPLSDFALAFSLLPDF